MPAYSKVAGDLPIEELPVLELSANKPYSIVRFETEVFSKGKCEPGPQFHGWYYGLGRSKAP